MRLLNANSLELHDFLNPEAPSYVILSHTWGRKEDEVLFEDIISKKAKSKKGFAKVRGCCAKAREDGFEWVWIDTCCIDKSSSAELSEAINSMFKWYHQSTVCYVYLQDVTTAARLKSKHVQYQASFEQFICDQNREVRRKYNERDKVFGFTADEDAETKLHPLQFHESRWFTRGWTLQELIAPKNVEFYTAEWVDIGTKASSPAQISAVTRVPVHVLRGENLGTCTIAERMSWASERQTTREEDMAYSLLGLFGINMPLLYGEGKKSFVRLQEEIMKQEEDYSLFAWSLQHDSEGAVTGMLASSPAEFSQRSPSRIVFPNFASEMHDVGYGDKDHRHDKETGQRHSELDYSSLEIAPGYRVLHYKDYRQLRRCIENGSLSMASNHIFLAKENITTDLLQKLEPREPPSLTSRGIKINLPVRVSTNPDYPSIAWLYCQIESRLVCVHLDSRKNAQLSYRYAAPWLVTVPLNLLKEFTLKEFHALPNGFLNLNTHDIPSNVSEKHWGRIKIDTLESTDLISSSVVSVYPPKSWSLDEIFFEGQPPIAGGVLLETSDHGRKVLFAVLVGFNRGLPFCEIMREPVNEGSLAEMFQRKADPQSAFLAELSGKSDRSVLLSDSKLFLTAHIRRQPMREKHLSAYVLRTSVYNARRPVNAVPGWITLHMSDLELQAEEEG